MGMLVVLESFTPAERVAFVLHDVFGMPFTEIADTVGRTPAACRQLASSARRRIADQRPGGSTAPEHRQIVTAFRQACQSGDLDTLVTLLDPDVESRSDGGGKVRAALRPVIGRDKVARLVLGLMRNASEFELVEEDVNGGPGITVRIADTTIAVLALDIHDGLISDLWMVVNPDKLHAWTGYETPWGPDRPPEGRQRAPVTVHVRVHHMHEENRSRGRRACPSTGPPGPHHVIARSHKTRPHDHVVREMRIPTVPLSPRRRRLPKRVRRPRMPYLPAISCR